MPVLPGDIVANVVDCTSTSEGDALGNQIVQRVVVITGASSGVGRACARAFGRRGDCVAVLARNREALDAAADEVRAAGGEAEVCVVDVSDHDAVEAAAAAVVARWGRIDVWVNNAGVTLFAPLTEGPFEAHRRVIETNVYGAMFGARVVIPVFRRQKHGVLINVGSVLSKIGQPFVPSYVISKFAVRGMSEALRAEVADEPGIHVCSILPYAIDTPHFQAGANELGRKAYAMPPVQSPERVARAIVELAARPRRERHVPRVAVLGYALHWLAPRTTERLLLRALRAFHFGREEQPHTPGNLYDPSREEGTLHGARPPQVSTPMFAAWVARELVKIEAQAARRRVQHWVERAAQA